jgi:Putative DNA-binding domain
MEFDLARFRGLRDSDAFVTVLEDICASTLTNDYWSITLPSDLATSAARSPSMFAFFAALNLHDARVLFSKHKVSELMDPSTHAQRASLERHHLWPKDYLKTIGVTETRDTNQIANYTMMEWNHNSKIANKPPSEYVPVMKAGLKDQEIERMYYWHALPDNWESLAYPDFFRQRRELMATVIRDAYRILTGDLVAVPTKVAMVQVATLVEQGETTTIEFKSTLRVNLHTRVTDPKVELAALKTIAAFLNSGGGTLIIGVADDGSPVGIEADQFSSEDKMYLHLVNLLKARLGPHTMMYVHPHFEDYEQVRVMSVECLPAKSPVFVKDGQVERFYVRTGAATTELTASETHLFVKQRFAA